MLSSGSCQVPLEQIAPRMKDTTSAKKNPENPPPRGKARQQVPSALGSRFARYRWADQRMAVNARVTIPSTKRKKCREMGEGELGEDETQMNPQIPNGKQLAKWGTYNDLQQTHLEEKPRKTHQVCINPELEPQLFQRPQRFSKKGFVI